MADTITATGIRTAEYRIDLRGNIDLYIDGEHTPTATGAPIVREVPVKRLRREIVAELRDAQRLGAAHGLCDWDREIEQVIAGEGITGCASYWFDVKEGPEPSRKFATVVRVTAGREVKVLAEVRPLRVAGEVVAALEAAFAFGARYGAPKPQ